MNLDRIISVAKSMAKSQIRNEFDWRAKAGRFDDKYIFKHPGVAQYINHLWEFYITNVSRECEITLDYTPFDTKEYGQRTYYLEKVRGGYIFYSKRINPVRINRLPANIDEVISVFEQAMQTLRQHQIPAIVHVILGLPGETRAQMLETVQALNTFSPFGIKLQLLHVLENTDLAQLYREHYFETLSKEAYLELVTDAIAVLSPDICIHRITGDGPKSHLIAPDWSRNKRDVLNSIHARMKQKDIRQGSYYESGTFNSL